MLRWLENYFARRATIRQLGEYIAPEMRDKILSGDYEIPQPQPREIEFVLILITPNTKDANAENCSIVISQAKQSGYIIEAFAGTLYYLIGGLFTRENFIPASEVAEKLQQQLKEKARSIYGTDTAFVGSIGSLDFQSYTALLADFPALLTRLCNMPAGHYEEFKSENPMLHQRQNDSDSGIVDD